MSGKSSRQVRKEFNRLSAEAMATLREYLTIRFSKMNFFKRLHVVWRVAFHKDFDALLS